MFTSSLFMVHLSQDGRAFNFADVFPEPRTVPGTEQVASKYLWNYWIHFLETTIRVFMCIYTCVHEYVFVIYISVFKPFKIKAAPDNFMTFLNLILWHFSSVNILHNRNFLSFHSIKSKFHTYSPPVTRDFLFLFSTSLFSNLFAEGHIPHL